MSCAIRPPTPNARVLRLLLMIIAFTDFGELDVGGCVIGALWDRHCVNFC